MKLQVQSFVTKGQTKEAIRFLLENVSKESPAYVEVANLSARYHQLERELNNALISDNDYQVAINKLNKSLLLFDENKSGSNKPVPKGGLRIGLGFLLALTLGALSFYFFKKDATAKKKNNIVSTIDTSVNAAAINASKPTPAIVKDPESELKILKPSFIYKNKSEVFLDIILKNDGDKTFVITKSIIKAKKRWSLNFIPMTTSASAIISTQEYDFLIPYDPIPFTVEKRMPRKIKPNDTDRFSFKIDHKAKGLSFLQFSITFICDEDEKEIESEDLLMSLAPLSGGCNPHSTLWRKHDFERLNMDELKRGTFVKDYRHNYEAYQEMKSLGAIESERFVQFFDYYGKGLEMHPDSIPSFIQKKHNYNLSK